MSKYPNLTKLLEVYRKYFPSGEYKFDKCIHHPPFYNIRYLNNILYLNEKLSFWENLFAKIRFANQSDETTRHIFFVMYLLSTATL